MAGLPVVLVSSVGVSRFDGEISAICSVVCLKGDADTSPPLPPDQQDVNGADTAVW